VSEVLYLVSSWQGLLKSFSSVYTWPIWNWDIWWCGAPLSRLHASPFFVRMKVQSLWPFSSVDDLDACHNLDISNGVLTRGVWQVSFNLGGHILFHVLVYYFFSSFLLATIKYLILCYSTMLELMQIHFDMNPSWLKLTSPQPKFIRSSSQSDSKAECEPKPLQLEYYIHPFNIDSNSSQT